MRSSTKASGRSLSIAGLVLLAFAPAASSSVDGKSAALQRAMTAASSSMSTAQPTMAPPAAGYTRTRYEIPITILPGANVNKLTTGVNGGPIPKPPGDFFLVRMAPNLVLQDNDNNSANDRVPRTDIIHLHHMVWLDPQNRAPVSGFDLPFGAGEEKTISRVPSGYGYPVYADQHWVINDMIHNLTPATVKGKIVYDLDWVPMDSALGKTLKPAFPLWLDVQRGSGYPVFDAFMNTGSAGKVTFPDQFTTPYAGLGYKPNELSKKLDMTLLGTAGHVHPGGLRTDLQVIRNSDPDVPASPQPGDYPKSAKLFRSNAVYYDPAGPVSWDLSMQATPANWRIHVKPYDKLVLTATYDTSKASWYESMGIDVVWTAINKTDGTVDTNAEGVDPFISSVPWDKGEVTHGSYPENHFYGGKVTTLNDPTKLANGSTPSDKTVSIKNFIYQYGDLSSSGKAARPPVIKEGQQLTFFNKDAGPTAKLADIYHSITDCKLPCNKETGLSYPLANGPKIFDSGQLGFGWTLPGTAAAQRRTWTTPKTLTAGTYSYFCRVHPFMRGAFRVVK
jgi:hypothetical protein